VHTYYLVDDDPVVLQMMERIIIQNQLGRVLDSSQDGITAEQDLLIIKPDVVVIDLLLPGQDGIQTIRNLHAKGYDGTFVMLSHVTDKTMVAEAYEAGIQFFISKPLNLMEIVSVLTRVGENLRLRQALATIQSTLNPLTTNPAGPKRPGSWERAGLRRQVAKRVLSDLGILGEAGASDLLTLADLPLAPANGLSLHQIYSQLADHYRKSTSSTSIEVRSIEQRLRRAAMSAQMHMAALGLEDFGDPRFDRLVPAFFDFNEVRVEMNLLRQNGRGPSGRINMKKFLSAFLMTIEEALYT